MNKLKLLPHPGQTAESSPCKRLFSVSLCLFDILIIIIKQILSRICRYLQKKTKKKRYSMVLIVSKASRYQNSLKCRGLSPYFRYLLIVWIVDVPLLIMVFKHLLLFPMYCIPVYYYCIPAQFYQ